MGHLRSEGFWVLSVDINENTAANANVKVSLSDGWVEQEANVVRMVGEALEGQKLTGILNVAGGWAGGNTQDADWVKNADLMWKQSVGVQPSQQPSRLNTYRKEECWCYQDPKFALRELLE